MYLIASIDGHDGMIRIKFFFCTHDMQCLGGESLYHPERIVIPVSLAGCSSLDVEDALPAPCFFGGRGDGLS
jgi:hypothetical protein